MNRRMTVVMHPRDFLHTCYGRSSCFGLCLATFAMATCGWGQWQHRLLAEGVGQPLYLGATQRYQKVNRRGDAMFVVQDVAVGGFAVYTNSHNLSALAGNVSGLPGGMNERGEVAWRGGGHVWKNGIRISDGLLSGTGDYDINIGGISGAGEVFWDTNAGGGRLYVGRTPYDLDSLLGDFHSPHAVSINEVGDTAWEGWGDLTGHYTHAFRGTTDMSALLGSGMPGQVCALNAAGYLSWSWKESPDVNSREKVFLNERDVSKRLYAGNPLASGHCGTANSQGMALWSARTSADHTDVLLDDANLTEAVYGESGFRQSEALYLSNGGTPVWYGYASKFDGWHQDVFAGIHNLSRDVLGPERGEFSLVRGVDDRGMALWSGSGSVTQGVSQVFAGSFNLSHDATSDYRESIALAMGDSGHTLWGSRDPIMGRWDIWLSTPVPEPMAVPGMVFGAFALAAYHRTSHRKRGG